MKKQESWLGFFNVLAFSIIQSFKDILRPTLIIVQTNQEFAYSNIFFPHDELENRKLNLFALSLYSHINVLRRKCWGEKCWFYLLLYYSLFHFFHHSFLSFIFEVYTFKRTAKADLHSILIQKNSNQDKEVYGAINKWCHPCFEIFDPSPPLSHILLNRVME